MLDPKNVVTLTAGVVADPEVINDKILKIRIGIDYAGAEQNSDNNSGYFDVVYYLKNGSDFASSNAKFVANQVAQGKMKKGSQIQIIGRLVQERWKQDDGASRSKVVIVSESISYTGSPKSSTNSTGSDSAPAAAPAAVASASIPSEF
jgi:single-stranded DNA-binding protein